MPLVHTFSSIPATHLPSLIAVSPKAELHVHIEGTLEPEMACALAERNGVALPYADPAGMRQAMNFRCLQDFLNLYYTATAALRTEQDFYDLAQAYLQRAAADRVVRAEIFFDPQAHLARGVRLETVLAGLSQAIARCETDLGVSAALLMSFLRDRPVAEAHELLDAVLPFRETIIGVGLDSAEAGHPPELFADVFARARSAGLHVVAHAGEEGPPSSITNALDTLYAERVDHGVRCLEDVSLVQRLARQKIPLTVCPLSNVRLQVAPSLAAHPLPRMLAAGLKVSVHSDDPAYFGGYLNHTLTASAEAMSLTSHDLYVLLRNSLESTFLEPAAIASHVAKLDRCFAEAAGG